MRFTKVFIATKPDMHDDIRTKLERFLAEEGIEHVNEIEPHINLAITIGGDGTLLHFQNKLSCPFFGINGGDSVGHYLSAGPDDFIEKLKGVIFGTEGKEYNIIKLMRLSAAINDRTIEAAALNEMILSATYARRMFRAELTVNASTSIEMNTCILAYTPTGSSAYASSAGAAKLERSDNRFGVCAVAPYAGILKKGEVLTNEQVTAISLSDGAELCVDGQDDQVYKLSEGDIVTIRKHDIPLRLVDFAEKF
ncbi:MAG: hypothetical protein GXO64_01395 [Candidatus Micrarchaeota archaeon]|nr:hypothetical protein [Candidatus Micrarchaeota archaeon]